ncbi:MAG: Hpt domain-containing protein, partial [Rhodopseudomonas sp.]|uniref:Hpt domain-containing protein n=1 Tax=Rhodopseudomonas sp. TaxID=1078 RepID=UPI0039E4F263
MTTIDPAAVFRQEAAELFEVLEAALLDLGQNPDDRELVDSAFRALHTIKGSGAMFGFDKVASFTHEFETAFERVRKGEIKPTQDLVSVALAAKDYIRALIETPDETDAIIGDAILADLSRFVSPAEPAESPAIERQQVGWHLRFEFDAQILRNGSNPLDLLDDLSKLGSCFATPLTDGIPFLDELVPEDCYLKWDVSLHSDCDKAAIDDVFMFVVDEMQLVLEPLFEGEAPQPVPMLDLPEVSILPPE